MECARNMRGYEKRLLKDGNIKHLIVLRFKFINKWSVCEVNDFAIHP